MSPFLYRRLINLHYLQSPLRKSFKTTSTTPSSSSTAEYLVKSCGLSLETAISASKKIQIEEQNTQNPDYVLEFLRSSGFSNTHIPVVITKFPAFLLSNVDKTLKPKMEFFHEMGFSNSNIRELIIKNPYIMKTSVKNHLKPSFDLLESFVQTKENAVMAIMRCPMYLTSNVRSTMVPNVAFLVNQGVPILNISKLIRGDPRCLLFSPDRISRIVGDVNKLGIQQKLGKYWSAIKVMSSMSTLRWERKIKVFQSFGLSKEEIMTAFKREPNFMKCSEEKIKRGLDFFVNTLKLKPSVLCSEPKLLMYALDKRIIPRSAVLMVLKSKNLIRENKMYWLFNLTEKEFLENYVRKYMDAVQDLMDVYLGKIAVDGLNAKSK